MVDLYDLLQRTSRTFGLAIPRLPEPTRADVAVAYLLFRVADTLEDAATWSSRIRRAALADMGEVLRHGDVRTATDLGRAWADGVPIAHEGYLELLREFGAVVDCWSRRPEPARALIQSHCLRTVAAMSRFVALEEERGDLVLRDLAELRHYCYGVAGIVGEMLTELFLSASPSLASVAPELRVRAAPFGEGLQLINILRDAATDSRERRFFLPGGVPHDSLWRLAASDLDQAVEYAEALQRGGADDGIVEFALLPIALAQATLTKLKTDGPGARITRAEVAHIGQRVGYAVANRQVHRWQTVARACVGREG
jgi:farnesyl-diphosphate farnesyltransferase